MEHHFLVARIPKVRFLLFITAKRYTRCSFLEPKEAVEVAVDFILELLIEIRLIIDYIFFLAYLTLQLVKTK